jgi:hypothetical protein
MKRQRKGKKKRNGGIRLIELLKQKIYLSRKLKKDLNRLKRRRNKRSFSNKQKRRKKNKSNSYC